MPERSKTYDSRKFMWDGRTYENEKRAKEIEKDYQKEGFETLVTNEGNGSFVYTRRVVTEIVLEGEAIV